MRIKIPGKKEFSKKIKVFQKKLGIQFKNKNLLVQSLTHRSFANEIDEQIKNNETLEYLGDSVLSLVINEHLFKNYPDYNEGALALLKSIIVSRKILYKIAKEIELGNFLLIGKGEELSGGRKRQSNLANCLEAIIGGYYVDSGLQPVTKFVLKYFLKELDTLLSKVSIKDSKSKLQELTQKKFREKPKYYLIESSGPDHMRQFKMGVRIRNKLYGVGTGNTKQSAEQHAAMVALSKLSR